MAMMTITTCFGPHDLNHLRIHSGRFGFRNQPRVFGLARLMSDSAALVQSVSLTINKYDRRHNSILRWPRSVALSQWTNKQPLKWQLVIRNYSYWPRSRTRVFFSFLVPTSASFTVYQTVCIFVFKEKCTMIDLT